MEEEGILSYPNEQRLENAAHLTLRLMPSQISELSVCSGTSAVTIGIITLTKLQMGCNSEPASVSC